MKIIITTAIKKHFLLAIFLLFYFGVLAYKLIAFPRPFFDWDESIYMQVGKEFIRNILFYVPIPTWEGLPWLEKPPLMLFVYGLTIFFQPAEISARLLTLSLSIIALIFIYKWVHKTWDNIPLALATVVITAWNPIFLQRSQTVNTDIPLLIGWLGYLLYFSSFKKSLFFLFLGVYTKSLLGLYPAVMIAGYEMYKWLRKKITTKELISTIKKVLIQVVILSVWYIVMFALYKMKFIEVHFADHLFARVTKSIESHFGQRTFYIDEIINQYGIYLASTIVSSILLVKMWIIDKKNEDKIFKTLFLLPFFLFLNLTKTKIAWYLYPTIPQFALLLALPITYLRNMKVQLTIVVIMTTLLTYHAIVDQKLLTSFYSNYNTVHSMATYAKKNCGVLHILPSPEDRKTHDTLKSLGLLISTSEIYGSNPSIMYYFEKDVFVHYSKEELKNNLQYHPRPGCTVVQSGDTDILNTPEAKNIRYEPLEQFGDLHLYRKH